MPHHASNTSHPTTLYALKPTVRIGVGNNLANVFHGRDDARARQGRRLLVLLQAEIGIIKVLVDDASHALLAVVALLLGAVIPNRLLVLDLELEDIVRLALARGELEAGEEAGPVGQGLARLGKGGLHEGMVLREEVPFYNVPNLGDDIVRVESEPAQAGDDGVCYSREGGGLGGVAGGRVAGCWGGRGGGRQKKGCDGFERHFFFLDLCVCESLVERWKYMYVVYWDV